MAQAPGHPIGTSPIQQGGGAASDIVQSVAADLIQYIQGEDVRFQEQLQASGMMPYKTARQAELVNEVANKIRAAIGAAFPAVVPPPSLADAPDRPFSPASPPPKEHTHK